MMEYEVLLSSIISTLLYEGIKIVIAVFLVFIGLKLVMTFLGAEENKAALVPAQVQSSERANPYVHIARALEEGDKSALVWLLNQKTPRTKIFRALNLVAVDLSLGIASLLSVLSAWIKIMSLPVPDWIVILMATAAIILVGFSYWRVKD